ncbi:MAG: IS1595 family transposase [Bacteroidales bacterium]|nr:IS1595 family transposase [Bacteroidales bacterium]
MIDFSKFNSIFELTTYFNSEDKCKKAIFESRWTKDDIICPFCGEHHCTKRTDGRFHCKKCGSNFSVLVGTIFENTKISLRKWFIAMYLISCHKKGISSVQLATDIHVTQKTAWYILHKVRTLFKQDDDIVLSGVVECDEMYLGGRETNKHESKKTEKTQGRSTKTKTPIFGMTMVWREENVDFSTGEVKTEVNTYTVAKRVADTKAVTLMPIIERFIAEGSTIVTDELNAYSSINKEKYEHLFVRHGQKEFVVGGFSTNGIEGFWGHFKRMVFGTYHFVSKNYLDRYIDEAVYRYNTRKEGGAHRFNDLFHKALGTCYYKDVKIAA